MSATQQMDVLCDNVLLETEKQRVKATGLNQRDYLQ